MRLFQIITISFLSLSLIGEAQEVAPIIVTANRMEQDLSKINDAVTVFDDEMIQKMQPQSFDDLFRGIPSVEFTGGPRVVGEQLEIRGQGGNEVTVRIDGVRQNFVSGHAGQRFFVDPLLLKSAEVVRGAKSHLYGSGAAGVVNFNTYNPSDFLSSGKNYGGQIQAGYHDVNEGFSYSGLFALGTENVSLLAGFAMRSSDDIELGNGLRSEGSAIDTTNYLLKAAWTPSDEHSLHLGYNSYQSEDEAGANPQAEADDTSNTLVDREIEFSQISLGYEWNPLSELIDLDFKAYFNETVQERNYISEGNNADRSNKHTIETLGFDVLNQSIYSAFGAENTLISGFEYYRDKQRGEETRDTFFSNSGGIGTSSGRPNAELDNFAIYAENITEWDNGLTFSLGLRFDSYSSESLDFDTSDSQFSPHVGLRYEVTSGFSIFGDYSRAFTNPTLNQLYADGSHFGNVPTAFNPVFGFPTAFFEDVFTPNPELNPQSSDNFEIGVDYNMELAGGELSLKALYFHQNGEDTFDSEVANTTFETISPSPFFSFDQVRTFTQTVNRDDTTIKGIEVEVDYTTEEWYTKLTYSNIEGKDDATGNKLNTPPGDKFYVEAGYHLTDRITLGAHALFVGSRDDKVDDDTLKTDSYDTYGLFASWQYDEDFVLTAGVNNLLDEDYERNNINNTEAGRNIFVSGTYRF